MAKKKSKCCEDIWIGFLWKKCSRNATITRNGKGYCFQHDPVKIQKKQMERNRRWEEEQEHIKQCRRREEDERQKRISILLTLAQDIPTKELDYYHFEKTK